MNLNDELDNTLLDDSQLNNYPMGVDNVESADDINEVQIVEANNVGSSVVDDTCYDEPLDVFEETFDLSVE